MHNLIDDIQASPSLAALQESGLLPEPYTGAGFYFIYYSRHDYKPALKDIVRMTENGLQVWYDRKINSGKSWEEDMLEKARNFHCACIVLYLSANSMRSAFFWRLCAAIKEYHLFYCAINLPDTDGNICSGYTLAQRMGVTHEQLKIAETLFNNDITFIPGTLTFDEKLHALSGVRKNEQLIYVKEMDYAVVAGVKDLSEEKIVVPAAVRIGEKEYEVKRIAPRAFANCRRLKELYLPDGIEYIGDLNQIFDSFGSNGFSEGKVFENCSSLEEIRFPASLKTINSNLFKGCIRLKRVYFGDNVTRVKCSNGYFDLTPEEYLDLGDEEKANDEGYPHLEELRLPPIFLRRHDGVILYPEEDGGWNIFEVDEETNVYGCTDLELQEDYLARAGEKIGRRFEWDEGIRYIDMRESDDEKDISFQGCSRLESVTLPEKLTQINFSDTFAECPSLKEIVLPKNLIYIEPDAIKDSFIETIVSDSIFNRRLFKSESFIRNKYREFNSLSKKVLYTIFCPLIMLFSFLSMILKFKNWPLPFIGLVCIATFPISIWYILFRPVERPFYRNTNVKTIYLRKTKKRPLHLKKFKMVTSDKENYDKYAVLQ